MVFTSETTPMRDISGSFYMCTGFSVAEGVATS